MDQNLFFDYFSRHLRTSNTAAAGLDDPMTPLTVILLLLFVTVHYLLKLHIRR